MRAPHCCHTELEILQEESPPVITHQCLHVTTERAQYKSTVEDASDDEVAPPVNPEGENAINEDVNYTYSFYTTNNDCKEMGDIGVAHVSATGPEPQTYRKATAGPDADLWQAAIKSELEALKSNKTFGKECKLPPGRCAIGSRFVFKIKDFLKVLTHLD